MTGVVPPSPQNIIGHVPGRICVGPTDLSTDYPHGGTALGEVADAVCTLDAPVEVLTAEEWGNEPHGAIAGGEAWSMAFLLRSWDLAAYSRFFLNTAAGTTSGHPLVESPGTNRAGYNYASRAAVFCFSPFDTEGDPFVVFYAGMPMVKETADLHFHLGSENDRLMVPAVIVATRDSSDRIMKAGRQVDIAL